MKLFRAFFSILSVGLAVALPSARAGQTFFKVAQPNSGFAEIQQLGTDPDGTTWVAGVYQNNVDFGGGIVVSGATKDIKYPFLAKQDANGGWIWVKTVTGTTVIPGFAGTPASQSGQDLTVTAMYVAEDSIYLTGIQGRFQDLLLGLKARNAFVMKVSRSGDVIWVRDFVSQALLTSVILGPDNNVYVGGSVGSTYELHNGLVLLDRGAATDREAAVFKLGSDGRFIWKVFCGGSPRTDEFVAGLAADGVNIHVLLNLAGSTSLYNTGSNTPVQTFATLANGMAPVVATLSTSGTWVNSTSNLLEARDDFSGFSPAGLNVNQARLLIVASTGLGTDIQLIGGKIYVVGSYSVAENPSGFGTPSSSPSWIKKGGFLIRLRADTHAPDGPVAYFRAPNDDYLAAPTRLRGIDNQIFVTGNMSTTLRVHSESSNTATPVGPIDAEATSVVVNHFVGKFDKDLNPAWLKTTAAANNIRAPAEFSAMALAFDDTNQRLFWGGEFKTSSTEKLAFGESPNVVQRSASVPSAWLTALNSDGGFLGQATLHIDSTYSPINVNGADVTAPVEFVFFRGTSARIKATGSETGGTRQIVDGYSINNVPAAATGDDILMDVEEDTNVKFQWHTQHLLNVLNQLDSSLGINADTSLGNVAPGLGKFWYDAGSVVNLELDGIVLGTDTASVGTRLVLSGYSLGPLGNSTQPTPVAEPMPHLTVNGAAGGVTMDAPKQVKLFWKKQVSVTVNHNADFGRELLLIRVMDANGNEISHKTTSGGESWFDLKSILEIGGLETDGQVSLKGWQYSAPVGTGYFPSFDFKASLDYTDDKQELLGASLQFKALTLQTTSKNYYVMPIPSLGQPVRVLWDYATAATVLHVAVGDKLILPTSLALAPGKWINARLVDGPPGSIGDNMLAWDVAAQIAVAVRPGVVLLEWQANTGQNTVVTEVLMGFNGDAWQDKATSFYGGQPYLNHIANTPPVELDPSASDGRIFKGLLYATADGVAAGSKFSATQAGNSVLMFYTNATGVAVGDPFRDNVEVRVVRTRVWNDSKVLASLASSVIGTPLPDGGFDTAGLGTGYVMHEVSNYNPDIYDRKNVKGPVIPVNMITGLGMGGSSPTDKDLVVVYYEKVNGILWPYKPVYYRTFLWSPVTRIVIASRLGSEGFDLNRQPQVSFDPDKFSNLKIYNQPDRSKPGFNPNEEHARIYPSLYQGLSGKTVPAAFALRNDLNIDTALIGVSSGKLTAVDYTSEPFVLVQYTDNTGDVPVSKMMSFHVIREDASVNDPRVLKLPGAVTSNYTFNYAVQAGDLITAPYPLNLVMGPQACVNTVANIFNTVQIVPNGSYFEDGGAQRTWFIDHKNSAWCVSGNSSFTARFFYRLEEDFYYPFDKDASDAVQGVGDCMPLLPKLDLAPTLSNKDMSVFDAESRVRSEPIPILYLTAWPDNPPVLKVGETLTYAGGENKADNPDDPGLPGLVGFASGEIVFDSKNPGMLSSQHASQFMARIIEPLTERLVSLELASLPQNLKDPSSPDVTVDGDTWYFNKLPPSLQKRLFYKPLAKLSVNGTQGILGLRGYLNDRTLGASDLTAAPPPVYLLEPNVLTKVEVSFLKDFGKDSILWGQAIDALLKLSRNPNGVPSAAPWLAGLEQAQSLTGSTIIKPLTALGPGLAMVTNPDLLDPLNTLVTGYVTVAENNHPSLGDAPVSMHVIKIDATKRYRGAIKTILPPNVFDEKITLRHTADFGGNVDNIAYNWWFHEEDGTVKTGDVPPDPTGSSTGWNLFALSDSGRGQNSIDLNGNPTLFLADNLFFTHYRHFSASATVAGNWSDWAGAANSSIRDLDGDGRPDYRAQLAMGWVKRVLDAINPYEARIRDFGKSTSPATGASLVQNLGSPFVGPVALNASKDVIENLGLIELYETVLKRARDLSIDGASPTATSGINAALLLASTRLSEFYTLLGHEAWDDALDPTIGFGKDSIDAGNLNASRFCFENQLSSLLDEELGLLRGVDQSFGRPVYNRLFWNFTKGEGEVAYALNYSIKDVNNDGFIDENDALKLYPMGHGDAWGHYLSAVRKHYDLLTTPTFTWEARSEYYNLLDVVLGVDFLDERNFARTAAARAKVGAEIANLTFRSLYSEAPDARLTGYMDSNTDRAWGVTEWARRAGQAALFDWITANAILPPAPLLSDNPPTQIGLHSLDRSSVLEIGEIATQLAGLQGTLDSANTGLNAIGLDPDVVPFDIDPTHLDVGSTAQIGRTAVQGLTHFEQIFERAFEALRNASAAFDYANDQKARERQVAQSAEQMRKQALAQDLDFRNRLIEIFGTPYEGQIGAGKAYPAGYTGPDLNLFMYVDVNTISPNTVPVANQQTYFDEYVSFYSLAADLPSDFQDDIQSHFLDDISLDGNTAVELLGDDLIHLKLPATAGSYTFAAPESWGTRAAPGKLQTMVGDMLQVQADLTLAVGDYDYLIKQLRDRVAMMKLRADIDADILGIKDTHYNTVIGLNAAIDVLQVASATYGAAADFFDKLEEAASKAVPEEVGTSNDIFSAVRGALKAVGATQYAVNTIASVATEAAAGVLESSKEIIDLRDEIEIDKKEMSVELRGMLYDIEELLVNEGVLRVKLFSIREQLRGLLDQYRATLQEGLRLLEERHNANTSLAADTQENRYHDMLFRSVRHESIQRYRSLYDLAQRYCYMAVKAYDYETNFDPSDRASAQPLLNQIARARTLGQLGDNFPLAGEGLAGMMAKLYDNFRAIEGRLGFNNLQLDTTQFSLRNELVRAANDDDKWKSWLATKQVADLAQVSEFSHYCRPFMAPGNAQPGLVIYFPTEIHAGFNFFGNLLQAGDSTYDPTIYATKIRSAGIRFEGYPGGLLARTPYVYLIPAGLDYMTVPNSPKLETRAWNVVDQVIPVPHLLGPADFGRPDWIATLDSLGGIVDEVRKFSSFRASVVPEDPSLNVTRFVGRSVWNDKWVLIIPGVFMNASGERGVEEFINNVTDIKLSFETYGYSGN